MESDSGVLKDKLLLVSRKPFLIIVDKSFKTELGDFKVLIFYIESQSYFNVWKHPPIRLLLPWRFRSNFLCFCTVKKCVVETIFTQRLLVNFTNNCKEMASNLLKWTWNFKVKFFSNNLYRLYIYIYCVCVCVYIYIRGGTVHRCHGSVRTSVR